MKLAYDSVYQSLCDLMLNFEKKTGLVWYRRHYSTNGLCSVGKYGYTRKAGIYIGIGALDDALADNGFVDIVDAVSMHKQCFHEYRHWCQFTQMFPGKCSFDVDFDTMRRMSIQHMLGTEFPLYVSDNYWNLSYEMDAEEYAIVSVRDYLHSNDLFSCYDVDALIVEEVNRRINWWLSDDNRPVSSVDEAVQKLHVRKSSNMDVFLDCVELDCLDEKSLNSPICVSFMSDNAAISYYDNLTGDDADKYLIDYICRHDKYIQKQYAVINDLFPKLTISEKMKRRDYRRENGLPDVNDFDRPLPDVNYSDTEGFDGPGLGE